MFSVAVVLCGMFLILLESTLLVEVPAWFGRPDLVFILVMWLAIRFDDLRELALAAVLGLMLDAASGPGNGIYPAAYTCTIFVTRLVLTRLNIDRNTHHALVMVGAYLLFFVAMWFVTRISGLTMLFPWRQAIPETAAMVIISYPLTHLFDHCLTPFDDREFVQRLLTGGNRRNRYL
jgi:rod shape-determining protein MreD